MKIGDLHSLVWKGDAEGLRKVIKENEHLSLRDIDDDNLLLPLIDCKWRGVTPLILAIQLGRSECVTVLLDLWADCLGRSSMGEGKSGFTPLQESASYGDREIIKAILQRRHYERLQLWQIKEPLLTTSLRGEIPDLYLELMIEFQSWIPLSDSFLPPPLKLKLWKNSNRIRIDSNFTSIETSPVSWTIGDLTIICDINDGNSQVWVLDHQKKTFQRVDEGVLEMKSGTELERQINFILNSQISNFRMAHCREPQIPPTPTPTQTLTSLDSWGETMDSFYDAVEYENSTDLLFCPQRKKLKFKKKESYWTGNHLIEDIMGRRCRVFEIPDIEIITSNREEHLRCRHLMENPTIPWQSSKENNFKKETKLDETNRTAILAKIQGVSSSMQKNHRFLTFTPSLEKPMLPSADLEVEWMSGDGSCNSYYHVGRKMYGNSNWRRVPITVWMAIPDDPSNDIMLELGDLLPLLELSLLGNNHFNAIKQFLLDDLPKGEGFPCQIDIPLYSYLTARITFGRIIILQQHHHHHHHQQQHYPKPKFSNEDIFKVPSNYEKGDVLPTDPSMTE